MKKKGIAFLLAILMLLSVPPVAALEEEAPENVSENMLEDVPEEASEEVPEDVRLVGLTFDINGQKVTAGEPISSRSIQPIKEHYFALDLGGLFPEEWKAVKIDYILKNARRYWSSEEETIPENIAVWAKWGYGRYILDSVYTNQVRVAAQIAIQRTCTAAIKASEVLA